MPVGQSAFLSHGVPAIPACGWVQVPFWQVRLPLQVLPAQHASEALPQPAPLVEPALAPDVELPAPEVVDVLGVPVVRPLLDPLLVAAALSVPDPDPAGFTQRLERHTRVPLQATRLQHAWPCCPQAGVDVLEEQATSVRLDRTKAALRMKILRWEAVLPRRNPLSHRSAQCIRACLPLGARGRIRPMDPKPTSAEEEAAHIQEAFNVLGGVILYGYPQVAKKLGPQAAAHISQCLQWFGENTGVPAHLAQDPAAFRARRLDLAAQEVRRRWEATQDALGLMADVRALFTLASIALPGLPLSPEDQGLQDAYGRTH